MIVLFIKGVFGKFGQWRSRMPTMGKDCATWCRAYAQFWLKRNFFGEQIVSRFWTLCAVLCYVKDQRWELKKENYGMFLGFWPKNKILF